MAIKFMEVNKPSPIRNVHNQERDSAGVTKFFYLVMLLLIGSSGVIGIAGIRQPAATRGSAVSRAPISSQGTVARLLVFHLEESGSGLCEDLTVTAAGDAAYSSCDHSAGKRYVLNGAELSQLQSWMKQFQPINYDHRDQTRSGTIMIQLYLNGQGSQQAGDIEMQQLVDFAAALAAKTASQP